MEGMVNKYNLQVLDQEFKNEFRNVEWLRKIHLHIPNVKQFEGRFK